MLRSLSKLKHTYSILPLRVVVGLLVDTATLFWLLITLFKHFINRCVTPIHFLFHTIFHTPNDIVNLFQTFFNNNVRTTCEKEFSELSVVRMNCLIVGNTLCVHQNRVTILGKFNSHIHYLICDTILITIDITCKVMALNAIHKVKK